LKHLKGLLSTSYIVNLNKIKIIMDTSTLNRREKRHYRQIVDGKVIYSNTPITDDKKIISSRDNSIYSTEVVSNKNIDSNSISSSNVSIDKKDLINKVLDNMSEIINPDLDVIANTIYDQLKDSNVDVTKKVIKETVSRHYRATTQEDNSKSKNIENNESENSIDRDKLKLVVDDLYTQIENENKTEEINASSKKEVVNKIKEEYKSKSKEKTIESKPKEKNTDKPDTKKTNNIKELLSDEEDLDLSDDEEDDMGLKF